MKKHFVIDPVSQAMVSVDDIGEYAISALKYAMQDDVHVAPSAHLFFKEKDENKSGFEIVSWTGIDVNGFNTGCLPIFGPGLLIADEKYEKQIQESIVWLSR